MPLNKNIAQAVTHLQQGHIIAYPTEAVYGLGCDPFNEQAVLKLYALKGRLSSKGYILIASSWEQIQPLINPLTEQQTARVNETWPGPFTWVFPASNSAPTWIVGQNNTIALRLTNQPLVKRLCQEFGQPIISTSANPSGEIPAKTSLEVKHYFVKEIDFILEGTVGDSLTTTPIRDVVTGVWYRK